jgi:shikimate dehydrogenase
MSTIATPDSPGPGGPYAEVIGDPVAHSKSPLIHNHWLAATGTSGSYRACHVRPEELGAYLEQRAADPDWRGCNVTLPHKLAVLDHVPDPGGVRASIGAANTIARAGDGSLFATNTDAGGFSRRSPMPIWKAGRWRSSAPGARRARCCLRCRNAGSGR